MFCACFFFICQLTFSDVRQPTFSKLFDMTWLQPPKKRCYADFLKVAPDKNLQFGGGRLDSDRDRRARLYGVGKFCHFWRSSSYNGKVAASADRWMLAQLHNVGRSSGWICQHSSLFCFVLFCLPIWRIKLNIIVDKTVHRKAMYHLAVRCARLNRSIAEIPGVGLARAMRFGWYTLQCDLTPNFDQCCNVDITRSVTIQFSC